MKKIGECAGLWKKWMSNEDIDEIEANILERRKFSKQAKKEKSSK